MLSHRVCSSEMLSMATNSRLTPPPACCDPNLSNPPTLSAFFAHAGIPQENCPFGTESGGGGQTAFTQSCLIFHRSRPLQHNCVLKRRLYETPDVQAQTHNPQPPNKKCKICTLFDDDLTASETFFCLSVSRYSPGKGPQLLYAVSAHKMRPEVRYYIS